MFNISAGSPFFNIFVNDFTLAFSPLMSVILQIITLCLHMTKLRAIVQKSFQIKFNIIKKEKATVNG